MQSSFLRGVTVLILVLGMAASLGAQDAPPAETPAAKADPLTIEAVEIAPAAPAADTLCRLRVRIRNAAERPVSALGFRVTLGGAELRVYDAHLFFMTLEPGAVTEVPLYNFWTTETGRPAPAGGKLAVEVTLAEAKWMSLATEKDGTEVWTVGEDVPGLPVTRELAVKLRK